MDSSATSISSGRLEQEDYDDYYITCNPSLTPDGATFVIEDVKAHFNNDSTLHAISYESEVPWINYSTRKPNQPIVVEYIHNLLCRLLDEDLYEEGENDEEPVRARRFMPVDGSGTYGLPDDYHAAHQFSEGTSLPYKDIWRGTEDIDGLTVTAFLQRCAEMLVLEHNIFERWEELELSGNCRDTSVRLTASDPEKIVKVKAKLDCLLKFFKLMESEPLSNHLIFVEGRNQCRFHFRWMATLGFDQTTLMPPVSEVPSPLAQEMAKSAVLRTVQLQGRSTWVADSKKYETVDVSQLPTKALTVFDKNDSFSLKSQWQNPLRRPVSEDADRAAVACSGGSENDLTSMPQNFKGSNPDTITPQNSSLGSLSSYHQGLVGNLLGDVGESLGHALSTHLLDEENPHNLPAALEPVRDARYPPAQDENALFDCLLESPKQLHRTMDQKAGGTASSAIDSRDTLPTHLQKLIETQLKKGVDVLRYAPGRVELKMEFGRLYHPRLGKSMVSDGTVGSESWSLSETLSMFGRDIQTTMFSPVLSSREADAKTLAGLSLQSGKWQFQSVQTFFDIFCGIADVQWPIVVELSAKDFSYDFHTEEPTLLSQLLIHCPQHAWDLAARAMAFGSSNKQIKPQIAAIVHDLQVRMDNEAGDVLLIAPSRDRVVKEVYIRRVATYRHNDSVLEISLTSVTTIDTASETGRVLFKGGIIPLAGPLACDRGNPQQWLKACVSSKQANKLLSQNLSMNIGDEASYDGELFQTEGILDSLYRPALRMISGMDKIGLTNNNNMRG